MDASHSLRLNLFLLSVVAMWPVRHNRLYSVLHHVSYLLVGSAFVFFFGELGTAISVRHDRKEFLGYMGLVTGHFMSLYKWCTLVINRRQLERLLNSLSACLKAGAAAERSAELQRFVRAADTRATVMTVCWMLGAMYVVMYWALMPLLHNGRLVELPGLHNNEMLGNSSR